jgi:hypothetical protein
MSFALEKEKAHIHRQERADPISEEFTTDQRNIQAVVQ